MTDSTNVERTSDPDSVQLAKMENALGLPEAPATAEGQAAAAATIGEWSLKVILHLYQ